MDEQIRNPLLDRIWYLPVSYKDNLIKENWNSIYSEGAIPSQRWDKIDWEIAERGPYIFLSRAPITFAHSILVVPRPHQSKSVDEATFFRWSAYLIERALYIFNIAFGVKKIHTSADYRILAEKTLSNGEYIKTLILKANANEDLNTIYKVHLLPYFKSHDIDCQQRFLALHRSVDLGEQKGGLLGWIGQREDQVDKYEVEDFLRTNPDEEISDLATKELALNLRSLYWENHKTKDT